MSSHHLEIDVVGPQDGVAVLPLEEIDRLLSLALGSGGIESGHVAIEFVSAERIAELNAEHRGVDPPAPTDVLSFPIDRREELPLGPPRQLGDAVLCPQVTGAEWQAPLVHGVLHLLGYDHGPEMAAREEELGS